MPNNNSKYTEEMREQTAKLIIETGKLASSSAEETVASDRNCSKESTSVPTPNLNKSLGNSLKQLIVF